MRYAYLGPEGTFTEAALRTLSETANAECTPFPTVAAALTAVRDGVVDAALVPLENSIEGGVAATMEEFVSGDPLNIAAEVQQRVEFALMAAPGTRLDAIRRIITHPHASAQCRPWLKQWLPDAQIESATSTAAAAQEVSEAHDDQVAAIAALTAAQRYGLEVLAGDIGQRADAFTRFVLVRRPGPPVARTGADRTSIVATKDDRPGWLVHALDEFVSRNVPLTRIDSRPSGSGLGRYHFLIDCEGHVFDPPVRDALMGLHQHCGSVRFLGSYPRGY